MTIAVEATFVHLTDISPLKHLLGHECMLTGATSGREIDGTYDACVTASEYNDDPTRCHENERFITALETSAFCTQRD